MVDVPVVVVLAAVVVDVPDPEAEVVVASLPADVLVPVVDAEADSVNGPNELRESVEESSAQPQRATITTQT